MDVPLVVNVEDQDDAVLVRVAGELDMWTSSRLREIFDSVDCGDHGCLNLDLSGVTFLDSEAIKVILNGYKLLGDRNVRCSITACSRCVERVLEISGFDRLLRLYQL